MEAAITFHLCLASIMLVYIAVTRCIDSCALLVSSVAVHQVSGDITSLASFSPAGMAILYAIAGVMQMSAGKAQRLALLRDGWHSMQLELVIRVLSIASILDHRQQRWYQITLRLYQPHKADQMFDPQRTGPFYASKHW